jgi:hypothetical protein
MKYLENTKEFIFINFSIITLVLGFIFIGSNTIAIGIDNDPTNYNNINTYYAFNPKNYQENLNTYYALNITGLVFFSLFVIKEYIHPYLVAKFY